MCLCIVINSRSLLKIISHRTSCLSSFDVFQKRLANFSDLLRKIRSHYIVTALVLYTKPSKSIIESFDNINVQTYYCNYYYFLHVAEK